jgi:hypothetical protein
MRLDCSADSSEIEVIGRQSVQDIAMDLPADDQPAEAEHGYRHKDRRGRGGGRRRSGSRRLAAVARAREGERPRRGDVAALRYGLGLMVRQRETLIGAVTLVLPPLTFLSSALMQQSLVPHWIQTVAKFNPVNWRSLSLRLS